mmetsp:Transcript_19870/g.27728  ORF Transcript_19870/g.27728 Transcript_19870/m.27728 type:complete len:99 (-) Transcript_19870:236-532(-)|eukprot:CAMPEP_0184478574 /NCGR_PEP_ID=MMETSP0113_2-20130426/566_1 /TAXON_ID=91329 /ORGANISM="Norrisiella sphaerica, Strain BC52" /LENGTH=98 /DNA_ID=CAMNT_0026856421 /DNA_START=128 /DNA_END=424 /DNA_ORIENTATION=+
MLSSSARIFRRATVGLVRQERRAVRALHNSRSLRRPVEEKPMAQMTEKDEKELNKKAAKNTAVPLGALALVALVVGGYYYQTNNSKPNEPEATPKPPM